MSQTATNRTKPTNGKFHTEYLHLNLNRSCVFRLRISSKRWHLRQRLLLSTQKVNWLIYIWPRSILQVKVKVMHISTANISQTMTVRANFTVAPSTTSHVAFRLAYLELILTYSKGQLGRWNGRLSKCFHLLVWCIFFNPVTAKILRHVCTCFTDWRNTSWTVFNSCSFMRLDTR